MKLAYISGPYRAKTPMKIMENVHLASIVALKYWKKGYAVICPHRNTALFDGEAPDHVWLQGDLEILKRCDVIVMCRRWAQSEGAIAEHRLAIEWAKEIIYEN